MWTPATIRCNIGGSRVVPAPGTLESHCGRSFPMLCKKSSLACYSLLFIVFLGFASPASAEWKEKVLYNFQGVPDGATPVGAVVFDQQGNLYGATREGGSSSCASIYQCGSVYQLSPPAQQGDPWTETVLYIFQGNAHKDGASPQGGLIIDSAGNLYGTTAYGGTGNCVLLGILMGCGTVFELSPPEQKGGAWTETVLYSFPTAKQGYVPAGDLVFDSAGNLYGATIYGGGKGTNCDGFYQYCGAVFQLSPPKTKGGKWTEKVLHAFAGGTDGANPNGDLVLDNKGAVYGTTYFGGKETGDCNGGVGGTGCGMVFSLTPPIKKGSPWTEQILHRFQAENSDGANPAAGVIFDADGNLFGTTYAGPQNGFGTVYEVAKPVGESHSWKETLLYRFTDGSDGAYPSAGLSFDSTGNLNGTALGGRIPRGVVFRLRPQKQGGSWVFTVLYNFEGPPDGAYPAASLVSSKSGALFSTTQSGGTGQNCGTGNCGTVFESKP
jgi:uncharacterized repeat protein (TIGR03803 family)